MTFTFTLWELLLYMAGVGAVSEIFRIYFDRIRTYLRAKRRADALRRAQRL